MLGQSPDTMPISPTQSHVGLSVFRSDALLIALDDGPGVCAVRLAGRDAPAPNTAVAATGRPG
jgi:hypothetical protein